MYISLYLNLAFRLQQAKQKKKKVDKDVEPYELFSGWYYEHHYYTCMWRLGLNKQRSNSNPFDLRIPT